MADRPIRRLDLSTGWVGDTDWTDPGNPVPSSARRLKFTADKVQFSVVGKSGTEDSATDVDVGLLTVDAYLGLEIGGQIRRGLLVSEAMGSPQSGRIRLVSTDVVAGRFGYFNVAALANVGALPALWIYLISGARPV